MKGFFFFIKMNSFKKTLEGKNTWNFFSPKAMRQSSTVLFIHKQDNGTQGKYKMEIEIGQKISDPR